MHPSLLFKLSVAFFTFLVFNAGAPPRALAQASADSDAVFVPDAVVNVLKEMSDASENYAAVRNGAYPASVQILTFTNPPFLRINYCAQAINGYTISCVNSLASYQYTATPVVCCGLPQLAVSTGGIFTPALNQMANNIALGKMQIKLLAWASELFKQISGSYPVTVDQLVQSNLISENYCGQIRQGFGITCQNTAASYSYAAKPYNPSDVGTQTFEITTGFVLVP